MQLTGLTCVVAVAEVPHNRFNSFVEYAINYTLLNEFIESSVMLHVLYFAALT